MLANAFAIEMMNAKQNAMNKAPKDKRYPRTMPKSANAHSQNKIYIGTNRSTTTAAQ